LKDFKKLLDCFPTDNQDDASIHTAKIVNALSGEIRRILSNH
jgi:hypothetical protein